MNTNLSKRTISYGSSFSYIFDINYVNAFGVNKEIGILSRIDGEARITYTATSDISNQIGTIISINPLKIFPDFNEPLRIIGKCSIWDKVLIFQKHKVSNISELEWCVCKESPNFITLISINLEIIKNDKILGRARIDPFTDEIGYENLECRCFPV